MNLNLPETTLSPISIYGKIVFHTCLCQKGWKLFAGEYPFIQAGHEWGCFMGFKSARSGRKKVELRETEAACAPQAPDCPSRLRASAHAPTPTPAVLNWASGAALLHSVPSWDVLTVHIWSAQCKASARSPLPASETRRSTKEEMLDFILLPIFCVNFLGIANGLCPWQIPPWFFNLLLTLEGLWGCRSVFYNCFAGLGRRHNPE